MTALAGPLGQLAAALAAFGAVAVLAYLLGRRTRQAEVVQVFLDAEREVADAVERARARPLRVDRDWVRRPGGGPTDQPPSVPPAPGPR